MSVRETIKAIVSAIWKLLSTRGEMNMQATITQDQLKASLNQDIVKKIEADPEAKLFVTPFPLDGSVQAYRGWYHIANTTKSRWCPKQSVHGGPRPGTPHVGADIWSGKATSIIAVATGTIVYNPRNDPNGWGNHIYLYFNHAGKTHIAVYAHLDASSAFTGKRAVSAGNAIGTPGCSGNAGIGGQCHRQYLCHSKVAVEDHLHFEVMDALTATRMDPVAFFGLNVDYANDQTCSECGSQEQLA